MPDASTGLITAAECDDLGVDQVHDLYRRFADANQVSLMTAFGFGRDLVDRADGVWLHTRDGRRVLDFACGVTHGHNHPRLIAARAAFAGHHRMEVHKTYFSPYVAALGHNLARLLPADLNLSFFPNSGAEAVEGAVKLAYKYHQGRRHTILCSDVARHGRLLGSGSLSAGTPGRFPGIPGVTTYRYDDLDSVRSAVAAARSARGRCDVYALLVEPFSAATVRECSAAFLDGVRRLCTAEGIVLVFDESRTGLGRTGSLFHFTRYAGLVPDVLVIGRALGGGKSSISAYVARERVFRSAYDNLADSVMHSTSTTYYGSGEETATAIEAVAIAVDDEYAARARRIEAELCSGLCQVQQAFPETVGAVRGRGAVHGIELRPDPGVRELATRFMPGGLGADPALSAKLAACAVVDALYRDHAVCVHYGLDGAGPVVVAPPLIAEPTHVARFLDALAATVAHGLPHLMDRFLSERVTAAW